MKKKIDWDKPNKGLLNSINAISQTISQPQQPRSSPSTNVHLYGRPVVSMVRIVGGVVVPDGSDSSPAASVSNSGDGWMPSGDSMEVFGFRVPKVGVSGMKQTTLRPCHLRTCQLPGQNKKHPNERYLPFALAVPCCCITSAQRTERPSVSPFCYQSRITVMPTSLSMWLRPLV